MKHHLQFVDYWLHLSIDAFTGTPATDWKCPPSCPRRTWLQQVEEDMASVPVSSQPWTADCGNCYDPQPVKRSSEWVGDTNDVCH